MMILLISWFERMKQNENCKLVWTMREELKIWIKLDELGISRGDCGENTSEEYVWPIYHVWHDILNDVCIGNDCS